MNTQTLDDGRILSLPISWYPRLYYGSQQERNNFRLIGKGEGIHREDLGEDIRMELKSSKIIVVIDQK
ncbi:MAG: DUF2442 domain-containing protein [Spirochaetales bacterium]|nr:DUF2442 domain-containing protein [Spirochaetales bacterium]